MFVSHLFPQFWVYFEGGHHPLQNELGSSLKIAFYSQLQKMLVIHAQFQTRVNGTQTDFSSSSIWGKIIFCLFSNGEKNCNLYLVTTPDLLMLSLPVEVS